MTKKKKKDGADSKPVAAGPYRNIEEAKKHQVSSFPDIVKLPIKSDFDFIINACDGIWDCYSNEQAIKYIRNKREKGPKVSKSKSKSSIGSKSTGMSSSPMKMSKKGDSLNKKTKPKGDTSFIIEEMMDQGIAKGDITMSDGTGTDNMTCVIL